MRRLHWFLPDAGPSATSAELGERQRRAMLVTIVCFGTAAAVLAIDLLRASISPAPMVIRVTFVAVAATLAACPLLMKKTGRVDRVAHVPAAMACVVFPLLAIQDGGPDAPGVAAVPALPLLATYLVGKRDGAIVGAVLVLEVVALIVAAELGVEFPSAVGPSTNMVLRATYVCIFAALVGAVGYIYETHREAHRDNTVSLLTELHSSSTRDALTGAYNRRRFDERLRAEIAYANRHGTDVGLVMMDLDHFKEVNDTRGHLAGDRVLATVAETLQRELRTEDVLARYGGEEFAVIARGANVEQVGLLAERLRRRIEMLELRAEGAAFRVTISAGCAALSSCGGTDGESLVGAADRRLYEAKHGGRNRVAPPPSAVSRRVPKSA